MMSNYYPFHERGPHQYTTTTFPTHWCIFDSINNGTSRTHTLSPRNQHLRMPIAMPQRTAGCTIALSFRRRSSSRNTISPSFARSRVPSSFKISAPNVETIFLRALVPGRTTSRARTSASITGMPRATSCVETVDFPVAIPPVKPITIMCDIVRANV